MKTGPTIILVNPQMGENIGAAARAMLNFGLNDLRLVAPRDGWPNAHAVQTASGAFDIMGEPAVFDTLKGALHDIHHSFATTARKHRELNKPVQHMEQSIQISAKKVSNNENVAFVFGAERTGLTNEHVSLCNAITHVPTNPEFSSLNLGQAVLLTAFAYNQRGDSQKTAQQEGLDAPATHKNYDAFLSRLETALDDKGFFKTDELKPSQVRNIRTALLRAQLSDQEIATFQGVLTALTKR